MARMPKLQKHPKTGVWRVRARVPDDCRDIVGKSEILHSLGTKDAKEAQRRAYPILDEIEKLFRRARDGAPVRWSNGKVLEPSDDYYAVLTTKFFLARAAELERSDLDLGRFPDGYDLGYDLEASLERFLREQGIDARRDSETFTNLLGEIRSELRSEGATSKHPTRMERRNERFSKPEGEPDLPLSKLLDRYLAEAKPSPQTSEEWRTVVRRFDLSPNSHPVMGRVRS